MRSVCAADRAGWVMRVTRGLASAQGKARLSPPRPEGRAHPEPAACRGWPALPRPGSAGRSNAAAHDRRKDTETTSAQAFIKCWLHPEFQQAGQGEQAALATGAEDADEGEDETADVKPTQAAVVQRPWPTGLTEQIKAVAEVLAGAGRSLDLEGLAEHFNGRGRWRDRLPTLLDTLAALGRARAVGDGRWVDAGI